MCSIEMRIWRRTLIACANVLIIVQFPAVVLSALFVGGIRRVKRSRNRRIDFGGFGIINLKGWSEAAKLAGFDSRTIVWATPFVYSKDTFDVDLLQRWKLLMTVVSPAMFVGSIFRSQTIVCGFDGFLLGRTPLRPFEIWLLRLARCKVVAAPYGGDAYSYSSVRSESLQHVLQISYPEAARKQHIISRRIKTMVRHADFVIPGLMGLDGIGRWDVLTPSALVVDINHWAPLTEKHSNQEMRIAHSPNHRGFKGTEFLIRAVDELRAEGHKISLQLLESMPNEVIRDKYATEIDVLVDQLVFTGYAMSGVEGLASGLVVIANLEDERYMLPFKRWSFLSECPIVSASPENIKEKILELYENPSLRKDISIRSREYAVKRHSIESFAALFSEIDKYIYAERGSLINYYHPLMENRDNENQRNEVRILKTNE